MILATLKDQSLDGTLIVVNQQHTHYVKVPHLAPHFRHAIENWHQVKNELQQISDELQQGQRKDALPLTDLHQLHSPLPRSFAWLDGSAFIQHVILVRKSRKAEVPPTLKTVPLMYQGGSDRFLAPTEDIPMIDVQHGVDFEAEVGVITDFVPMGTKASEAHRYILFLVIINDVTLRGLTAAELAQGFGFLQSKPASSFAPFALTPDELGENFRDGRVHLPLLSEYNGKFFGNPDAGEMFFSFSQLIEHAARTRHLSAGTIIGSGTVSNEDETRGSSCLAEKRMLEQIKDGEIKTPFMNVGDTIKIEMRDKQGRNLFGTIQQKVSLYKTP